MAPTGGRKISVIPEDDSNRNNVTVPGENSNRSNVIVLTGERKKITNKVHERGGNEGTVDSRNANKCNVLLVVHKGIEIQGVVGSKMANNRNGLSCSESNSYRMSGTVGVRREFKNI